MTTTKKPHIMPTRITSPNDRARAPKILDDLYNVLGTNVDTKISYEQAAREIGVRPGIMQTLSADFIRSGVLVRSFTASYNGSKVISGRSSFWRLPYPVEEAKLRLSAWWRENPAKTWSQQQAEKKNPVTATVKTGAVITDEPVAVRMHNGEAVEAIAGPDPVKPFESLRSELKDDASALIEAARQYKDRHLAVKSSLHELEKLGITINWDNLDGVISLDVDERLEAISLVIPYVDQLLRSVDRMGSQNSTMREKAKTNEALATENGKLREQVNRLIAAKVGRPVVEPYR